MWCTAKSNLWSIPCRGSLSFSTCGYSKANLWLVPCRGHMCSRHVGTLRNFHLYSELSWDPTGRDFSVTQYSCGDMVHSFFRNAYFICNFLLFDPSISSNHAVNFLSMSRVRCGKGPTRTLSITQNCLSGVFPFKNSHPFVNCTV